jgi:ribonucleoside-diphosphate reductase alpha chain
MIQPRKRTRTEHGVTLRYRTGCGNLFVTINRDKLGPFEVFTNMGKNGNCGSAQMEGLCRAISVALRSGVDPHEIIDQLSGISCPNHSMDEGINLLSCSDAIAHALKEEEENYNDSINKSG